MWLLGSSDYSALLAAELGLRFGFAHFISAQGGAAVTRAYRERFRPSAREPQAAALACVFVICADSNAEAERLAATIDLRRLHMAYGNDNVVPSTEEALSHRYSAEERAYVEQQRARLIHGDAARVKDRLQQLSEEFGADELLAITITGDYASRLRSYQLLAEELL